MLARDDQDVGRGLRVPVAEGDGVLTRRDDLGGHLTGDDGAEQAVRVARVTGCRRLTGTHGT